MIFPRRIDYLTEFYSYTIVGNTMHWIQEECRLIEKDIYILFQNHLKIPLMI